MTNTPFTLADAEEVAEDFEDLIDTEFKLEKAKTYYAEKVAVGPFHEEDKQEFVKNYLKTKDKEVALGLYSGSEYDVLLLACDVDDDTNYICIDIRTFADQKGISYAFP